MLKKKTDKATQQQLDQVKQQLDQLRKAHSELEVCYNRSCCREQDLQEQLQQQTIEKEEAERKLSLLVGPLCMMNLIELIELIN